MDVTVLFFAAHRELAGTEQAVVSLPERATVEALLEALRGRGDGLAMLPGQVAVAVNRRYADSDVVLSQGDEVALIPPVAGG